MSKNDNVSMQAAIDNLSKGKKAWALATIILIIWTIISLIIIVAIISKFSKNKDCTKDFKACKSGGSKGGTKGGA